MNLDVCLQNVEKVVEKNCHPKLDIGCHKKQKCVPTLRVICPVHQSGIYIG